MTMRIALMLLLSLTVSMISVAADKGETATQAEKKAGRDAAPTTMDELSIQADTVEMDFAANSAVFTGNVHVEDSAMVLNADKMTIFLKEGNELRRIEAEGNVTIREIGADRTAKAGKAVYDVENDTVTLSESPSLIEEGKGMMTEADTFVYKRAEQKFVATGRPKFKVLVKKGSAARDGLLGLGAGKEKKDDK
jgi:lipopolysaccharide transport protein LptA